MLQEAMLKLYVKKSKQNTNKLQEIESSFAGVLGLTFAGQSKVCAVNNEDFSSTFPLRNYPNDHWPDHWPDHWLQLSFAQQVHAQAGPHWFISAVRLLRTRSLVPVLNGPKLESLLHI